MSASSATATAQLNALQEGTCSSRTLVQASLERIESRDSAIGAWVALRDAEALAQAEAIDARRQAGEPMGPLAGLPIGIKDMICTRDLVTTAGSRMLREFRPPYDATVVARLRAADAVIVGKLNQDEFAMGSSGETSCHGVTRNPWDLQRVPGGSSSGSAAAVADHMVPLTLGTDTGGSIRQPASFCGVVGVKPTYGRVSRWGVVAFASSLDQVGPLGRSVEDCARVLEVIAGHDPRDSTSIDAPVPSWVDGLGRDVVGMRVGVPGEYFGEGVDTEVDSAVKEAIETLRGLGATLVPISLPHTRYAIATYYVLATAEASSNLARYDGVRYGHRCAQSPSLETLYEASRSEGFGAEVKRRILLGTFGLSAGYYDAYYGKAQRVRTLIRRDFEAAFAQCDVIASPTAPTTAFSLGAHLGDPLQMYMMDICTIPASLAGLPAMSLPCGFDGAGLPIGLQLMSAPLDEMSLLQVAHAYEQSQPWRNRRPADLGEVGR